jgi:PAS domain S-box-containing protein
MVRGGEVLRSLAASRQGIGARLLMSVLLFSGAVTLILTAIQLYLDYRRDVSAIAWRVSEVSLSYRDSLAEGLWNLDERQLRLQLSGILRLPDIRAAEVRETGIARDPLIIKLGETPTSSARVWEYPLVHNERGRDTTIGTFRVEATLAGVYARLVDTALTILVSQAAKTFVVSFFILFVFHYLVTRHLSAIAADLDSHRINERPLELRLRRRPPRHEDELQRVVSAFNALSSKLHTAYRDLTEREAKIRRLVDSNIIGILIFTMEGQIVEANDAFLRMVGYDREDLVSGRVRWKDMTPSEWHHLDVLAVAALESTGSFQGFEKEYFRKDGSRVPVLVGGAAFEENGAQGVAFVVDLTERKRAEYLTRQAFDSASDAVAIVGTDYRYRRVNPVYERYFEVPAEKIVGMRVAEVLGADLFERTARPNLERCFAGEHWRYADWFTTPRGRFYFSASFAPLRLDSERVDAALVITRDLTEHMRASEGLREAQAALARVNRVTTLGVLAASIAHEVNQPLGAMVTSAASCSRWLAAQPPDFDKAQRALERIGKDGRRASEVIDRIRTLVRRQAPRKEPVDINEAIREVIALTRDEVHRNEISLETALAQDLPPVQGDRVQLQQVILNLAVNAIEAMSAIGDRGRELAIRSAKDGGALLVEVRDSGPGIDPARVEQLFEALHTTKAEGIGMGLSISRSIIEAHGGRLWAGPNQPHGAVFRFSLPLEGTGST